MAFASVGNSMTDTAQPIGQTDWDDPGSAAQAHKAIWEGRNTTAKARAEAEAWRNLSFFQGDQWSRWVPATKRMERDNISIFNDKIKPNWEKRLKYNLAGVRVTAVGSKMLRNNAEWDFPPVTEDQEDDIKARVTHDVMDWQWSEGLDMPTLYQKANTWAMCTKTVFFDWYWDANDGDPKQVTLDTFLGAEDAPMLGGDVDPIVWAQQKMAETYGPDAAKAGVWNGKTGRLKCELAPIFEINGWPFNANEFSQWQIVQRVYEVTADEAAQSLGLDVEAVRAKVKEAREQESYRNSQQKSAWQREYLGDSKENDGVLISKVYVKPSSKYPNGKLSFSLAFDPEFTVTKDNPYRDVYYRPGLIPIVPLQNVWVPNSLWGHCLMDDLIDPQKDFNIAASQESNARNYMVMPTLVRKKGDLVGDDEFSAAPGGQIEVQPGMEPEYLVSPPPSDIYTRTMERNRGLMDEISAVSQVDFGTSEGGNPKSGRGILALQEQNDGRLLSFARNIDTSIQKNGEVALCILQDFQADEQTLQAVGKNNQLEVIRFSNKDLRPSNYGQEGQRRAMVKVETMSQLPSTRAEMRQTLEMLITGQVLNPLDPEDKSAILEMWGVGSNHKLLDRGRKHQAKQQQEIDLWKRGQSVPPPSQTDNHTIHRLRLADWMNTQEYKETIAQNPNPMFAQEISDHLMAHRQGEIQDVLRQQYDLKMADFKLWLDYQQKAEAMAPGLGSTLFPAPLGMMMQAAAQGNPNGSGDGKAGGQGQPGGQPNGGQGPPPGDSPPNA